MARPRLTQEQRKARSREAILAAATRLIAQRGVEATSLDEVAKAAGFTKGAIYGSFANKRALIDAVIERHKVEIDPSPLFRADLSLTERLGLMAGAVIELQRTMPRETALLDLECTLDALRNPREWGVFRERARAGWGRLPDDFAAVNAAQRAKPPFPPLELLTLLGLLTRALLRATVEIAGTAYVLSPDTIETLFRLLGGEGQKGVAAGRKKRGRGGRSPAPKPRG